MDKFSFHISWSCNRDIEARDFRFYSTLYKGCSYRGPELHYEIMPGVYQTIPENKEIRCFIWEHMQNVNRIVQRIKYCRGTFCYSIHTVISIYGLFLIAICIPLTVIYFLLYVYCYPDVLSYAYGPLICTAMLLCSMLWFIFLPFSYISSSTL